MTVLICDANIFIDLLKMDLIDEFFMLNNEMVVSSFVIEEVLDTNIDKILTRISTHKLRIFDFNPNQLSEIQILNQNYKGLSVADCSCLSLSKGPEAILLTNEKKLKIIAENINIKVHGILWILNKLIIEKIVRPRRAIEKLLYLKKINPRLPDDECQKFINRWHKK